MDLTTILLFGLLLIAPLAYYLGRRSQQPGNQPRPAARPIEEAGDSLFALAPLGYLEIDLDGIIQRANRCECTWRGLTADQLVGRAYRDLKTLDDPRITKEFFLRALFDDSGDPAREQYTHPDGHAVSVEVHKRCLRDASGRVTGIRLASINITEQTRNEEEALKTTRELKAIFDAFPDSFLRINADHVVLDYKGAPGAELEVKTVGRRVEEIWPGAAGERLGKAIEQLKRNHAPFSVEFAVTDRGQPRFFEIRMALIHWTEVIALMRNITDRKVASDRLEEFARELQEKNDQLAGALITSREATRFKTRFLANMSHEILTPMNAVLGMTELLLETPLNEDQTDYARTIRKACDSLIRLVDNVLDLSRMESGKFTIENTTFDLRTVVEDVVKPLTGAAHAKNVEVTSVVDPRVPGSIRGDAVRLRQVLSNLLENALKFTERGVIALRVELAGEIEGASTLRFVVKDTGIGVRQEQVPLLFDSFVQADDTSTRKYGGAGLGLAVAKQLVEMMRGEIGAESQPGKGSTFWFTAVFEKPSAEKTLDVQAVLDLRAIRILLSEGNAPERAQIRSLVELWGGVCEEPSPGHSTLEALRIAAASGNPFKLALVSMDMRGQDGIVIGHAIKSDPQVSKTILIALTDSSTRGHGPVLRAVGFEGHVQKPVLAADLRDTIAEALDAGEKKSQPAALVLPPPEIQQAPPQRIGKARILLVEDDYVNQKFMLRILQKSGFQTELAEDGRRAVDAVLKGNYDLVLMDVQMPTMDGLEATAQIRFREGSTRHTPIIGLTANAMAGDRERCLGAGMDEYLSKPVSNERLMKTIDHWVGPGKETMEEEKSVVS